MHTRADNSASLFDVGHMGQIKWYGKDAARFLETVCVADVDALKENTATLTLITNENGGIKDDAIITRFPDHFYMVVNGSTKFKDMKHFDEMIERFKKVAGASADVRYEYNHSQNLVALQGPGASAVVQGLLNASDKERVTTLPFMNSIEKVNVAGATCTISRCGYTGEDGYEISVSEGDAVKLAQAILADSRVLPAGLGARDSLRLEAGLCLYGNDLNEEITPGEASLIWTIGKTRREGDRANFLGAEKVLGQIKDKSWQKKRVGLSIKGAPAREGAKIYTKAKDNSSKPEDATLIGTLTSGTFAPCLKAPIGMGYVPPEFMKEGTELTVEVRGKLIPAVVAKMPWVPHKYYK